jgi:1,4-alpha-glucan branching enzyme
MKKTIKKALKSAPRVKKEISKAAAKAAGQKGLKKQYFKNSSACKVTFRLPKAAAPNAQTVTIVGDFNNWNLSESKMQRLKNGDFKITLNLPCDREYKFRYLIDADKWENDWFADKYIPNKYGEDDSVVVV